MARPFHWSRFGANTLPRCVSLLDTAHLEWDAAHEARHETGSILDALLPAESPIAALASVVVAGIWRATEVRKASRHGRLSFR